jgi:hypothetical protein
MKKIITAVAIPLLLFSSPARADLFGGDVAVLSQILVNALQQLAQLRQILSTGRDNVELVRDINRGINDSLELLRTVSPNTDPGIYKDWQNVQDSLANLEKLYGIIIPSRDEHVQRDADQSIAEAIAFNNSIYAYTKQIDEIGENIKTQSHFVSPGGAAKLTAESLGVMLHIQNESLRAQATGLKLQAQAFALENRKDKDRTRQMLEGAENLKAALSGAKPQFTLPRF